MQLSDSLTGTVGNSNGWLTLNLTDPHHQGWTRLRPRGQELVLREMTPNDVARPRCRKIPLAACHLEQVFQRAHASLRFEALDAL
jgi:hypothetical protein